MLSFATPAPIFSPGTWDHHRPSVPSPLSSSPVRASSPLSPIDGNAVSSSQRQIQSSPIQPSHQKFRFASRPTRPNPVVRKREDAQDMRRRNFLQSVRQKSEDKKWLRRDIEGQFVRDAYYDTMGRLAHGAPELTDADIEDAMTLEKQFQQPTQNGADDDMAMDDEMLPDEDAEMEAMVASYQEQMAPAQQQQQQQQQQRPVSPSMLDDDYDDIFAELIAQEQQMDMAE